MSTYIICTRNVRNNTFRSEPGKTNYLILPDEETKATPDHSVSAKQFLTAIVAEQVVDVTIFVHGTDYTATDLVSRHKQIKAGLKQAGYTGELISFDWPSNGMPLAYLDDRHDAKKTAMELVTSGITLLAKQQGTGCLMNIHAIAHSSGAFVIQEAFEDAETTKPPAEINWTLSQLLFIGGDVSSDSLSIARGEKVYRHCNRLTNYYNPYDAVLAISNVKRVGFKNRVGRVGLPGDIPPKAVDVNCGNYYHTNGAHLNVEKGKHSHAWYFYSDTWYHDVVETIKGDDDRNVIATRMRDDSGSLALREV